MTVSFSEIPYDWRNPGVFIEARPVYDAIGLTEFPARAVLVVQKLASGSAVPGQLYTVTREADGAALFGRGSIGQEMVAAFKANNRTTDCRAIALEDLNTGIAASGTITFGGTGAGVVSVWINNRRARFTATATMTAAQMATALAAAITALPDMPVTAAAAAGVVTLTAKHKGTAGNAIDLRVGRYADEQLPAGITAAIVPMASGAGNPDVTAVLDALAGEWITDWAFAWDDAANLAAIAANFADRYKAMGKRDAHGYLGHRGTFGELGTKGALTNVPFLSAIGAKRSPSPPWAWAAALAGVAAFQLTNDPARQLRSLVLAGIAAPDALDGFTDAERDLLLRTGISTWTRLSDGSVVLDRVITTYKTSTLGAADTAWLDIMTPKTVTRIRYDWATYIALTYPRHKLADDGSVASHYSDSVATPKRLHGSWASRCALYERLGWIEDTRRTLEESHFERDESDRNRVNASQRIRILGNLMILAAELGFDA